MENDTALIDSRRHKATLSQYNCKFQPITLFRLGIHQQKFKIITFLETPQKN